MIDVVITTFNRHEKVAGLIRSLLALSEQNRLGKIIVVDSTAVTLNPSLFKNSPLLLILKSSHQNQPYQRYLGLKASQADFILFLDDDMEILDDSFCEELPAILKDGFVGINLKFKNNNEFLAGLKASVVGKGRFSAFLRKLSGYPSIQDNQFWFAGIRGKRSDGLLIQYLNGGAFLAKRELLFKGISSTLWDIYDKKFGKGEDAITGFALSRQGKVLAHDKTYFYHNDQNNSVYTSNHRQFHKRVAFSRLFLSFEYARLTGISRFIVLFHYVWYSIWRIFGLILNVLARPRQNQLAKISGFLTGFFKALVELIPKYFLNREDSTNVYWDGEISADLEKSPAVR